ncbi:MarR family winged helix-turn-helix transcriptional regulator [Brachybacterium saurashtrense]|uniref:MarR family transcriptional regulator n=1 Tax=Brachybacterium saurashtrense TaxID=556288 RepID=A0A345YMZ1_9MICO|nr:MarR family winged helix-turn-helix transcriptional regulator [Brachybacterium saurashtrense]AXK45293.1 MarR family transcriptional regulator [Brachybacterium saurashtrense]RRR21951.1 MarR family transcriptional regulator [Brachybacterium saurashtrense]
MSDVPLPPDARAARLAEVYVALGPVYRRVARIVEQDEQVSGLSVGVRNVLDQLRRDGRRTVPQLARTQDLSRQYTQRMVDRARADGLVELVDNPAHRRSRLVRLTPAGDAAIAAVLARERSRLERVGGDLTAAELAGTLRVLHHMDQALLALEEEG